MPIRAECQGCGQTYRVKDELVGRRIKCKQCGEKIPVVDPDTDDSVDEDGDDEDEYGESAPALPSRKRVPKKKRKAAAAQVPQFSTPKIAVMIMIAVLTMRLPVGAFWWFRSGAFVLILSLARLAVGCALVVGGYGLFQRTTWAERVVWAAAIAQIVVAVVGLGYSMAVRFALVDVARAGLAAGGWMTVGVMSCALPIGILVCMAHEEWDA